MEAIKLLKVEDIQSMLGVSRKKAIEILSIKGCPVLPRKKHEPYLIREEAFVEWFKMKF